MILAGAREAVRFEYFLILCSLLYLICCLLRLVERILDCSRKLRQRLTEDAEDYEAEIEALEIAKEAALKEAQDLREQIEDLIYKHANVELVNKLSDDDRGALMTKCEGQEREIVQLKGNIKTLSEQINTMQANYEALVEEKKPLDTISAQYQALQSQKFESDKQKMIEIDLLNQEVDNLKLNLLSARENITSLQTAEKVAYIWTDYN